MEIKTRREAAIAGETKYWTGRQCGKAHDSPRYTSTGICCKCNAEATKAYSKRLRSTINAKQQGHFSYPSHPADHAAALAYCQALDLQRGRQPHTPDAPVIIEDVSPEQIQRMREQAFGHAAKYAPPVLPPREIKP